ncbi:MAG: hypothetical protein H6936_03470 [Burkholderiales bacterium]|nr:hypothetical protein [Nitrosomonas sp.]MCP5273912.1 hypothetical protein [Burkholderiales bacterium]
MDDDSSNSLKQFRFDIVNGQVVAFFEVENGITQQESIESQDSFEISGNQITHTEIKSNGIETTIFVDEDGDGFYTILSSSNSDDSNNSGNGDDDSSGSSGGRKSFEFEIINGEVVSVFEVKDGQLKPDPIESNEVYTVEGNDVIRTEIEAFGTEVQRYSDSDGDGRYQRVSEQWIPASDNITGPKPVIDQSLLYASTDGDDLIAVRSDDSVKGGLGSDSFVFRIEKDQPNHWRIDDFHADEGDRLIFDTGLGLTSKQHLASFITELSFDGQNFFVGFTPDVSITLVGVTPALISPDNVEVLS